MRRFSSGGWCCVLAFALVLVALLGTAAPASAALRLPRGRWPLSASPQVLRGFEPPLTRYGAGHRGVDLAAARGTPVLAAADGTVTFAGPVAGRGVVVVDHGAVRTTYEPVAAQVSVGQRVRAGAPLGVLSGGSHCARSCLHWGLRAGEEYLNPLLLLDAGGDVRLVAATERAVVERDAARRVHEAALVNASLLAGPGTGWVMGTGGQHGFGHPVPGAITSPFGVRLHPILRVWKLHDGTDFGAGCGTPIRAPAAGRVSRVSHSSAYGNRLFLDHGRVDGLSVVTGYNHAERYVVHAGQHVAKGQLLGYVGETGYATGCHLHLMVWLDADLANPMTWFAP
ncbi:peptidoglycan DD-metalloendopeptidase family protein [uncultured Friedmanniella sp.]|uniref:peptidoglycan DD-metalloendopeptidase family protein n=1 Tax=uncultured Friedmanniella sp. TaxID=335381 RepID=UPI0035CA9A85